MKYIVDLTVACGVQHLPNTSGHHARIYANGARWAGSCPQDRRLDHVHYNRDWDAKDSEKDLAIVISQNDVEVARIVPAEGNDPTAFTIEVTS